MQQKLCLCDQIEVLETRTRVSLVMHQSERTKPTATGPLALLALRNSELFVHGVEGVPLSLSHLDRGEYRLLVLFPAADARELTRELVLEDSRPVNLIVPDGGWRQASRAARRIPGFESVEKITLPMGLPTQWGLRRQTRVGGLATFEAIARSLGILEDATTQLRLEQLFLEMVGRQASQMPYVKRTALPAEQEFAANFGPRSSSE
jgi:DTW domain-containing protein YfiP